MQVSEQGRHPARCLLVDDDDEIRHSIADFLARSDFAVVAAADGRTMRRIIVTEAVDVIVLGAVLPDESGLDLCQWSKRAKPAIPIIVLTAPGAPGSRAGPGLGADDCIAKPFEPRELVARIDAVLRRARGGSPAARSSADDIVRFEGWQFDRVRHQLVSPAAVVIALSGAEFRLLTAFLDRPGRLMTREQLLELTRAPGTEANDRSIDLAVSRLRHKFQTPGHAPDQIKTVRGEGYLFDAVVDA